jgi:hypothetical protein
MGRASIARATYPFLWRNDQEMKGKSKEQFQSDFWYIVDERRFAAYMISSKNSVKLRELSEQ